MFNKNHKKDNDTAMQSSSLKCNLIPEDNYRQFLILLIFAIIMVFIRTVPVYDFVFTDWPGDYGKFIQFAMDDAVYHMRLVHNTIHHFPERIFFDPYTHFPFGAKPHFGPLFTLMIAGASLIAGLGHPSPELVNIIGVYTPVVLGVLCLFPVYFIARRLLGKTAAILAAFVFTFLPGIFLQRSVLGFTDHHVAEVLFSTVMCLCLIRALMTSCLLDPTHPDGMTDGISQWRRHIYATLTGISFGCYMLIWPAALMFGAIFLVCFITLLVIHHIKNESTRYLLPLVLMTYGIAALFVLPYALMNPQFESATYSLFHPAMLLVMAGIFVVCYVTHLLCKKNRYTNDGYSVVLMLLFISAIFIVRKVSPDLFALMRDGVKLLFVPTPEMRTVGEVRSAILHGDQFTIAHLWRTYYWALPFACCGLLHLGYRVWSKTQPAEILLFIWSITIILASFAQLRFNYYLAVNMAILAGGYGVYPVIEGLDSFAPQKKFWIKLQKFGLNTFFIIFIFLIVDPILMLLMDNAIPRIGISRTWYDSLMWLKKHTPDPTPVSSSQSFPLSYRTFTLASQIPPSSSSRKRGSNRQDVSPKELNYAAGYYPISQDITKPYNYPPSAYGIMAFWDIGHQITYIAERMPTANPFQQGLVEYNKTAGAAPFFTSRDEEQAMHNLDLMQTRYVIVEKRNADGINSIGIWCGDTEGWTESMMTKIILPPYKKPLGFPTDSKKLRATMVYRLYYDDGNGLKHMRLIHESSGDYTVTLRRVFLKPRLHIDKITLGFKNYKDAKKAADKAKVGYWGNKEKTVFIYAANPPTKGFKFFEKVRGAVISGAVPKSIKDGTKLEISLKLQTKYKRTFYYKQVTAVHHGKYQFTVPYPTVSMKGEGYAYDITPVGKYQIRMLRDNLGVFSQLLAEFDVTEKDVINGSSFTL